MQSAWSRYVSNASPVTPNVSMTYAYDNQFIALNMSALFALPHMASPLLAVQY